MANQKNKKQNNNNNNNEKITPRKIWLKYSSENVLPIIMGLYNRYNT